MHHSVPIPASATHVHDLLNCCFQSSPSHQIWSSLSISSSAMNNLCLRITNGEDMQDNWHFFDSQSLCLSPSLMSNKLSSTWERAIYSIYLLIGGQCKNGDYGMPMPVTFEMLWINMELVLIRTCKRLTRLQVLQQTVILHCSHIISPSIPLSLSFP